VAEALGLAAEVSGAEENTLPVAPAAAAVSEEEEEAAVGWEASGALGIVRHLETSLAKQRDGKRDGKCNQADDERVSRVVVVRELNDRTRSRQGLWRAWQHKRRSGHRCGMGA
jgi:hypothetical protein